eukprot:scaffold32169_cov78-Skeletonema_dohrnii-CCMP3373.AAC.3
MKPPVSRKRNKRRRRADLHDACVSGCPTHPKKKPGARVSKKERKKNNTLVPLEGDAMIGDLPSGQDLSYKESCEALPDGLDPKIVEFRQENIKKIKIFSQGVKVTVEDTELLNKEVTKVRDEMLCLRQPELAEYADIILSQTIKGKEQTIVLCKCPTPPRGGRPSQSIEMLSYGDDITNNATFKVIEVLAAEIPNRDTKFGGPAGVEHIITLNLCRICSAVTSAFKRRSAAAAAASTSDDSSDDDDDSTYAPDSDDDDDSCCLDGIETESLGIFLKMIHESTQKLGGKGLVVFDASGKSSNTNETLWETEDYGDMEIIKDIYHLSMYKYGRGNFETTFANVTANCKMVSENLRRVFPRDGDNTPHGRFFENCADREDFLMVGRGNFDKKTFYHRLGKSGAADLMRNLKAEGVDIGEYFSDLGKLGYEALVTKLESQGISISEYFADLGRRSYKRLLMKLEAAKISVHEYFSQLCRKGLDTCTANEWDGCTTLMRSEGSMCIECRYDQCSETGCDKRVVKDGSGMCPLHRYFECAGDGCTVRVGSEGSMCKSCRYKECSETGCTNLVKKAGCGLCSKHREKKRKLCSFEGCPNQALRGGLCGKHGGKDQCSFEGCPNQAKSGGLCDSHGGKKKKLCSFEGCPNQARCGGFCDSHGEKKLCSFEGCPTPAVRGGFCHSHGEKKLCSFEGCPNQA